MTLIFNSVRAVLKIDVHAKCHQAKCTGSRVIVRTGGKNSDENNAVRRYRADSNEIKQDNTGDGRRAQLAEKCYCALKQNKPVYSGSVYLMLFYLTRASALILSNAHGHIFQHKPAMNSLRNIITTNIVGRSATASDNAIYNTLVA